MLILVICMVRAFSIQQLAGSSRQTSMGEFHCTLLTRASPAGFRFLSADSV